MWPPQVSREDKIITDTTRDFIQSVHHYIGYALLYRVCIIIQNVHYYTECALLYRVCIIIQDVHYYTGCALLYGVCIIIQNAHYYATRYFTSSRLTFSPTAANIRTLYDT